jgi:hypothetical protein
MENCIVSCSCLPKESKRDLKFKVQAMAGIFSPHLVTDATHLITNGVKSEKYNVSRLFVIVAQKQIAKTTKAYVFFTINR